VRALRDLVAAFPERGPGGVEESMPIMRWADASPVTQPHIRKVLRGAAVDLGMPADATGTHSLRVAGATAIYAATQGNKGLVQRMGRWASDAFQGYVWEDRSLTLGLASKMVAAPWAPHKGLFE